MILKQGDCLELMDELITQGIKVDGVITDPPYGMDYQSNRRTATKKFDKIKNDVDIDDMISKFFDKAYQLMNDNTAIYVFCSWHRVDFFKQEFEKHFKLKNILVWNKNNHGSGDLKGSFAPKHEFILYGHKGRSLHRCKRIPDVLNYDKISSKMLLHPTEKNIEMLKFFCENNSDAGQIILDPFMGSGTTGAACINTGRDFIGFELDENYFHVAENRIKEVISNKSNIIQLNPEISDTSLNKSA